MDEIGTKAVVWIVDSQQWPRAYLRALLLERDFDAIGFMELAHALAALKTPHYPKPHFIVLDLHAMSPTEEEQDILTRLRIPLVALAGAMELSEGWIKKVQWAALIQRPVTIAQVADVIEKLTAGSKREKNT